MKEENDFPELRLRKKQHLNEEKSTLNAKSTDENLKDAFSNTKDAPNESEEQEKQAEKAEEKVQDDASAIDWIILITVVLSCALIGYIGHYFYLRLTDNTTGGLPSHCE